MFELETKAAEAVRLKAVAEECEAEKERLAAQSGQLQEKLDSVVESHQSVLAEERAKHEAALGAQQVQQDSAAAEVQQMLAELRGEHAEQLASLQADHQRLLASRQQAHQEELASLQCKLTELESAWALLEKDKLHRESLEAAQQEEQQQRVSALEERLAMQEAQHAQQLAALQAGIGEQQAQHAAELAEQQAVHDRLLREAQEQAQKAIVGSQQGHHEAEELQQQLEALRIRELHLVQLCETTKEQCEAELQRLQERLAQETSLAQQRYFCECLLPVDLHVHLQAFPSRRNGCTPRCVVLLPENRQKKFQKRAQPQRR